MRPATSGKQRYVPQLFPIWKPVPKVNFTRKIWGKNHFKLAKVAFLSIPIRSRQAKPCSQLTFYHPFQPFKNPCPRLKLPKTPFPILNPCPWKPRKCPLLQLYGLFGPDWGGRRSKPPNGWESAPGRWNTGSQGIQPGCRVGYAKLGHGICLTRPLSAGLGSGSKGCGKPLQPFLSLLVRNQASPER